MRGKIRKIDAYFTIEAACVFPLVLGIQMLLVYALFFQYDKCLSEQDVILTAYLGDQLPSGRESIRRIAWEEEEITFDQQFGKNCAKGGGVLKLPAAEGFLGEMAQWQFCHREEFYERDPVVWLWLCRSVEQSLTSKE